MLDDKSAIKVLRTNFWDCWLGWFFYLPIVFGVVPKSVFLDSNFWVLLEML